MTKRGATAEAASLAAAAHNALRVRELNTSKRAMKKLAESSAHSLAWQIPNSTVTIVVETDKERIEVVSAPMRGPQLSR